MRLFFGLDLSWTLKEALGAFQARHGGLKVSWTDPSKLHLTLAFLGEVPEERLDSLRHCGEGVARRHPSIRLRTTALGGFPRDREARVLWLGLEVNPTLESLVAELRRDLAAEGFAVERKPFAAHLTLARFRVPVDIALLGPAPAPLSFTAAEVVLYRSHLLAKGSRYERIQAFPLNG